MAAWLVTRLLGLPPMLGTMFVVTESDAAAIRATFDQAGEFAAAIELRRLFPGITDNVQARMHARTIAGYTPLPVPAIPLKRPSPRKK